MTTSTTRIDDQIAPQLGALLYRPGLIMSVIFVIATALFAMLLRPQFSHLGVIQQTLIWILPTGLFSFMASSLIVRFLGRRKLAHLEQHYGPKTRIEVTRRVRQFIESPEMLPEDVQLQFPEIAKAVGEAD